jgi:hypothetical protein
LGSSLPPAELMSRGFRHFWEIKYLFSITSEVEISGKVMDVFLADLLALDAMIEGVRR